MCVSLNFSLGQQKLKRRCRERAIACSVLFPCLQHIVLQKRFGPDREQITLCPVSLGHISKGLSSRTGTLSLPDRTRAHSSRYSGARLV
jgi:hypothetical protein